jgi:hypothetical protein
MIHAARSVRSPLYDVRKHAEQARVGTACELRCFADFVEHDVCCQARFKQAFFQSSSKQVIVKPSGGARRDRTDDLMLAKHALSQLSYGPVTRRRMLLNALVRASRSMKVVGLGRLELPTSRLSSARSNQLSYKPLRQGASVRWHQQSDPCPDAAPGACSSAKKEKRRRRGPANGAHPIWRSDGP